MSLHLHHVDEAEEAEKANAFARAMTARTPGWYCSGLFCGQGGVWRASADWWTGGPDETGPGFGLRAAGGTRQIALDQICAAVKHQIDTTEWKDISNVRRD